MSYQLDYTGTEINKRLQLFDLIYPVGSIYMSVNSTSPASLFGGEWEQIKDTFLLAAGGLYNAGTAGGEAEHVLTNEEMPEHNHKAEIGYNQPGYGVNLTSWEVYLDSISTPIKSTTSSTDTQLTNINSRNLQGTSLTGKGQAHNNMPPYLAVYMWKRTA